MASLTGQTIADSYEQVLSLPDGGGNTTTLVALTDGDGVNTFAMQLSTTTVCIDNPTASSSTQGGLLRLQSDDGAVMASGHRLGVIEFGGAEDTSNTITTGARIEAVTDATWSGTENGAYLSFYTTDGNASQTEGMRLDATSSLSITNDLTLSSDASILSFGAGNDVTFTHDNGTGMNVASAGDFDIAVSAGNGTFTVADGQTLLLGQSGASALLLSPHGTAGSELASLINTAGTTDGTDGAGAILLSSVAGGIGFAWADTMDLWAEGGQFIVTANHDTASCIKLHADAGTSQTILIQNDAGTGASAATEVDAAIQLSASAGGIGLYSLLDNVNAIRLEANGGTSENIIIHSNQGTSKTEGAASIQLLSDAGGINIKSEMNSASSILITADGGANESITIHSDQGSGAASIGLYSDAGGITIDAGTDIVLDAAGDNITLKFDTIAGLDFTNANSGDAVIQQKTDSKDFVFKDHGGAETFRILDATGGIKVGGNYTIPATDGSADYILKTNGSGAVSWAAIGDIGGNATTATTATNVVISDNESTDENNLIAFVADATGADSSVGLESDGDFHYNPNSGLITATKLTATSTTASTSASTGAIYTTGGIGCAENSYFDADLAVTGALTITGVLTAGSIDMSGISNSADITIDSGSDVILDADGDDFIFKVGEGTTSSQQLPIDLRNELMRITWGNGTSTQGAWNTGHGDKSVLRFQHVAKVASDSEEPSSPVFQFAGLDIDSFDDPTAGCLGEISKHGFIGYGILGDESTDNQCLGNGKVAASAIGNVLINKNATGTIGGDYNVLIGENTGLRLASHGSFNIGIGRNALLFLNGTNTSNAWNNIAIGQYAGLHLTTGSGNIQIGNSTGHSLTTGYSNICIGNSTVKVSDGNAIGQIVMGYSGITGSGNNTFTFGLSSTDTTISFGTTTWSNPSDIRYKEDIQDEVVGLNFINDLRPVTFLWKKEKDVPKGHKSYVANSEKRVMNGKHNHGFIAQEVKEVIDSYTDIKDGFDMWSEDETDGRQRIGDSALVPILVKAVQELSARVEHLEANNKTVTHIN